MNAASTIMQEDPGLFAKLKERPMETCMVMTDGEVLNIDKPCIPEGAPRTILEDYYHRVVTLLLKMVFDSGNIEYVAFVFIESEIIDVEYDLVITLGDRGGQIYCSADDGAQIESEEEIHDCLNEELSAYEDTLHEGKSIFDQADAEFIAAMERDNS